MTVDPFEGWSIQVEGIAKKFADLNRTFANLAVSKTATSMFPEFKLLSRQVSSAIPKIDSFSNLEGFKKLFEAIKKSSPSNFVDIRIRDQLSIINVSCLNGFGTVEALPEVVLNQLLALGDAPTALDIDELLSDHTADIFARAYEVEGLRQDQYDQLCFEQAGLISQAAKSLAIGHVESSQALSTVIWDSNVCSHFGQKGITKIDRKSKKIQNDDSRTFSEVYFRASYGPLVRAYQVSTNNNAYSRNGTVHHARRSIFSHANALRALTLAIGAVAYSIRWGDHGA